MKTNKKLSELFSETEELLKIKGAPYYKTKAYKRAAQSLAKLKNDVSSIYEKEGKKDLEKIEGVGKSIAEKIEEYIKKGRIKYIEGLREETAIRQIITKYFETKDVNLAKLKRNARQKKIVYARHTRPAKELLELAGDAKKAKKAIEKVAIWAGSRNLDYTIETATKRWLEIPRLKPKEKVKKAYYRNMPMIYSEKRKKWFVIDDDGTWLEFADTEDKIEWREE